MGFIKQKGFYKSDRLNLEISMLDTFDSNIMPHIH